MFFSIHKATTTVYQVTRPGHEHCDVTEGVLLDITPLDVDGKKLVTLYDKDLTEGVNLLIGKQRNTASSSYKSKLVSIIEFEFVCFSGIGVVGTAVRPIESDSQVR